MQAPAIPSDELQRLDALRSLNILDTPREEQFDRIVRLVATHFRVPLALISLVDEKRQWFKAAHGLAATETPRDISFCGHAILGSEAFIVPDACGDERFCDNPLVVNDPNVRFYAGQPIVTVDGYRIGTLCIIDHVPRNLQPAELDTLRDFARLVENELNATRTHQALELTHKRGRLLDTQHETAIILADGHEPEKTFRRLLRVVCSNLHWSVGNILLPAKNNGVVAHNWSAVGHESEALIAAINAMPFTPGACLPEHTSPSAAAVWIRDLAADCGFPRAPAAAQAGLRSAILLPIRSNGAVLGLMEYFSKDIRDLDQSLMGVLEIIAGQIGQYLDRRQKEASVTRLSSELDAIFSLSPDGFLSFDYSGKPSYVNPALLKMLGLDQKEMAFLSASDFDRMIGQMCDPEEPYAKIDESPDGSRAVLHLVRPKEATLSRTVRALTTRKGESLGKIIYVRDITNEAEADRMKSEFLSIAAHELRTPMASIYGYAELLLHKKYDEATRKTLLETIHTQAGNLIKLVNELLDLARIEARKGADFNMAVQPLFATVQETVAQLLVPNDDRKVTIQLPEKDPAVDIDIEKFRQVLLNMVSNAYKYSPNGGAIKITCRERRLGAQKQVGVAIRDHGIGMTEEQLAHLFKRFYRADPSGNIPGTGLGMSVSKEIMEILHGTIDVSSTPGAGTEVILWLPEARLQSISQTEPV